MRESIGRLDVRLFQSLENKLIFLRFELSNFYMFDGAVLDLTYKKKVSNSTIEFETLKNFEKIKFKRVCIISGANASGKTNLGKMLNHANAYIVGRDVLGIGDAIRDKDKLASFYLEFADSNDGFLYSIKADFDSEGVVAEECRRVELFKSYTYDKAIEKLNSGDALSSYHRTDNNHDLSAPGFKSLAHSFGKLNVKAGWNYSYADRGGKLSAEVYSEISDLSFMEKFLKIFDSSITRLEALPGDPKKDEFRIYFENGDTVIVSDGQPSEVSRLSRGTNEAIEVSYFAQWLKTRDWSVYYLDEKMAYSHTDMEQAILNWLISNLGRESQLFYTTHNHDILGLNLPSHSFVFLRKNKFTEIIHPEKMGFTKNDRSLVGYVENDVFGTLPDVDAIEALYD